MPTNILMPALSPTMEEGTLAKWLVKEGDTVNSGDILAEIETDKATMEFEAVDEGKIAKILVPEGSDGVKVGTPIAILAGEGEAVSAAPAPKAEAAPPPKVEEPKVEAAPPPKGGGETPAAPAAPAAPAPKAARTVATFHSVLRGVRPSAGRRPRPRLHDPRNAARRPCRTTHPRSDRPTRPPRRRPQSHATTTQAD